MRKIACRIANQRDLEREQPGFRFHFIIVQLLYKLICLIDFLWARSSFGIPITQITTTLRLRDVPPKPVLYQRRNTFQRPDYYDVLAASHHLCLPPPQIEWNMLTCHGWQDAQSLHNMNTEGQRL